MNGIKQVISSQPYQQQRRCPASGRQPQ
jgi:hypothetical protein